MQWLSTLIYWIELGESSFLVVVLSYFPVQTLHHTNCQIYFGFLFGKQAATKLPA